MRGLVAIEAAPMQHHEERPFAFDHPVRVCKPRERFACLRIARKEPDLHAADFDLALSMSRIVACLTLPDSPALQIRIVRSRDRCFRNTLPAIREFFRRDEEVGDSRPNGSGPEHHDEQSCQSEQATHCMVESVTPRRSLTAVPKGR